MEKYLDKEEFDSLIKDADPKYQRNYNLFKLDPREKEKKDRDKLLRRNFCNPDDPQYLPVPAYDSKREHESVYNTEKVLDII